MPEHLQYDDDAIFNPETHHEKSDVNVRALMWAVVIFVVFAIVTHLLLWLLYKGFANIARGQNKPPLTSMARPSNLSVPDQPRLQPFPTEISKNNVVPPYRNTPVTDLADMRAAEEAAQNNPGWVDQQKGIVRLPIELAKQLALQRGFPVVPATSTAMPSAAQQQNLPPAGTPRTPLAAPQQGEPNAARIDTSVRTTTGSTTTTGAPHP
jgi:hypothetical protein